MRFCLLTLLVLSMAAVAQAAPPDDPSPQSTPQVSRPAPDFLFGHPRGSVGVRGGWLFSRGRSDWYDFVTNQLTLEKRDFNQPAIGFDAGVAVGQRMELVFGLDFSQMNTASEFRDFVDNNRLPITQETRLRELNISGSLKFALTERGREVSRLAWVPRSVVPYVGGGAGALWYQVRQAGDFVDFVDFSIFPDVFESEGWTPSAHVFGGVDIRMWRKLFLTVDGRYLWAAGDLGPAWIDFEDIDLAGARLAAGINVVF